MSKDRKPVSGKKRPLVSIVCISFNQEKFIAQAIDGFLMQKHANFEIEIIIADDASTDDTANIIKSYQRDHTNIRVILREKNIGIQNNLNEAMRSARGDYIALCEGDDYWIDENKLQKQVDYLEQNPDHAVCFHPVRVFYQNDDGPESIFPDRTTGFTADELLKGNFIQTNSVMYRRQNYEKLPNDILPLDWYYHLYHAQFGKIGFVNEVMAAYRKHSAGVWWSESSDRLHFLNKHGAAHLRLYQEMLQLKIPGVKSFDVVIERACGLMSEMITNEEVQDREKIIAEFPEFSMAAIKQLYKQRKISQYLSWKLQYAEILLAYERGRNRGTKRMLLNGLSATQKRVVNKLQRVTETKLDNTSRPITIVIPIYDDWPSLKRCIQSVKKYFTLNGGNRVLLMNDVGPNVDEIEKNIRALIQGEDGFIYHRNPKNLGFIGNCNAAVQEVDMTDNEILLLNSDAELTEGAIEEMQKVLYRSGNIATVTPRSNNATVFSVPFEAAVNSGYPPEKSYDLYRRVRNVLPDVYETPTGHGFCLLIRRSAINKYGLFDTAYGRGYCEENDFCMRVRRHGYTHAVANWAYVIHEGSKSFTSKGRDEQIAKNHTILTKRYPEYDYLVAKYVYEEVMHEELLYVELPM